MSEVLTLLGGAASAFISIITLLTLVLKPVRQKLKDWIRQTAVSEDSKEAAKSMCEIKSLLEEQKTNTNALLVEINHVNSDISVLKESSKSTLKSMISDIYTRGRKTKTISSNDKETLSNLYDAYHALGGNHYTSIIYDEMMKWDVED